MSTKPTGPTRGLPNMYRYGFYAVCARDPFSTLSGRGPTKTVADAMYGGTLVVPHEFLKFWFHAFESRVKPVMRGLPDSRPRCAYVEHISFPIPLHCGNLSIRIADDVMEIAVCLRRHIADCGAVRCVMQEATHEAKHQ